MPIPLRISKVEYNSLRHPVMGLSPNWHHSDYFQGSDTPPCDRTPPRCGSIWSAGGFTTELRGSSGGGGVAKTPPDALLLKACALKETVATTVSTTYAWTGDIITDFLAVDLAIFHGNALKENCTSAVGDLELRLTPNNPGLLVWSFAGLYAAATEAASAQTLETAAFGPICKSLTITVGSKVLRLKSVIYKLNNTNNSPNLDIASTNGTAAPNLTYSYPTCMVEFEQPAFTTYNAETQATGNTKNAISAVLGATAGNIFTITMDGYPANWPEGANMNGNRGQSLTFAQATAAADTKFNIVCT